MESQPKECVHPVLQKEDNLEMTVFKLKDERHVYRCINPKCGKIFIVEPFELKATEKLRQSVQG